MKFYKNNSSKNEITYTGFGIFCIISTICTMFSIGDITENYDDRLLFVYGSMLVLSVLFITYPIWPNLLKKDIIIETLWHITIFYLLIICSSFFVLLNNFNHLQFVIFTVNLIAIAILIRWKLALSMIIIGVYISIEYYKYYTGITDIDIDIIDTTSFIFYSILLISAAVIVFLKPQQEKQELIEEKTENLVFQIKAREEELDKLINLKNEFLRNINHEVHAPMTGITSLAETLYEKYYKLDETQRKAASEIIAKSSARLTSLMDNLLNLSKLLSVNYDLNILDIDLSYITHKRIDICKKLYLDGKALDFITKIEPYIIFPTDEYYMNQVLDNLIINAINYSKVGTITITLERIDEGISFSLQDQGIGVPKEELSRIFDAFVVSSKTKTPAGGRGIGLTLCKKIIEIHNGKIWAENNFNCLGTTFNFILYH